MATIGIDDMIHAANELADVEGVFEKAFRSARGYWADNPFDPSVEAYVVEGKLHDFRLAAEIGALGAEALTDLCNAVIVNAHLAWKEHYDQLVAGGYGA